MTFNNIPTRMQWQNSRGPKPLPPAPGAQKSPLFRVDELIQKYWQVFDMSKLNVLMELKNTIIEWSAENIRQGASPAANRLEAMQALMEIVLYKLYELDGWGKHRYIKVACLGYVIQTGKYDETRKPLPPGPANPAASRGGKPLPPIPTPREREERIEIEGRVAKLQAAIAAAHTGYQGYKASESIPDDEDRKTLKIFMAPEFFFRGPYGAYQDIGWNAKILEMMRRETSKAQYADWLFVHGSAVFSTDKMVNDVKVGNLLENYALVQKGGPKTKEHQDLIFAKEFPSHVDFKHPGLGDDDWYDPAQSAAKVGGKTEKHFAPEGGRADRVDRDFLHNDGVLPVGSVSELVGGTIFTMDSITFGLEVCRDHLIGRLKHSPEAGKVLIQLVPSCGANVEFDAIACVPDGIIFNVDGSESGPLSDVVVNSAGGFTRLSEVFHDAGDGNQIAIYKPVRIPWPGLVPPTVATQLNMMQSTLSGTAPPTPPKAYPIHPRK
jgi:hypothetical protein